VCIERWEEESRCGQRKMTNARVMGHHRLSQRNVMHCSAISIESSRRYEEMRVLKIQKNRGGW